MADHGYTVNDAPDGAQAWGFQVIEVDPDFAEGLVMRRPLVQVTAFSIDRAWNRKLAAAVLGSIGQYAGWMGSVWVSTVYESEGETSEQIAGVNRWAYSIDLYVRYTEGL